jgi:light-regulated signal transduction histidine kinase (bacteriophytochrome)
MKEEELAYTLSHDLSALVRQVLSFAQLLEKAEGGTLPEKSAKYLNIIISKSEEAQKMLTELVKDLRAGQ